MPPEIKTDRTAMVDGALALIEERGDGALSARTLADRLGISTQPIYREFGDMDGVRRAVVERGWQVFTEYVSGDAAEQAVRYVMFAVERKKLFNFLFRGRRCNYDGLDDMAHKLVDGTDIIERLQSITGLSCGDTYKLHLYVWMALHGLAAMSADNDVHIDCDEIKNFTVGLTRAVTTYLIKNGDGGKNDRIGG